MEKETGGKTKVLFENKEPQVYKAEDVSVSMNSYTLVELNGFHTDFNIPFNRQTEGGVILVNYSVKIVQLKIFIICQHWTCHLLVRRKYIVTIKT